MNESNGDQDGKPGTELVVTTSFKAGDLLKSALGRSNRSEPEKLSTDSAPSFPTEVRRVRRGKFFLSNREQTTFGSIRRPIFEYWGHGVVVGETVPRIRENEDEPEGMWCYGAHNDFDLVPEFMKPSEWPEYVRTPTGFVRVDGDRRLEVPSSSFEKLMAWNMKQLRLK